MTRPTNDNPPAKLRAMAEVRQLYAAMQRFDLLAAKALGVNLTDLRCINVLRDGELTPSEIGARLGLTSGSVTALVDRLELLGAVRRTRQADRRSVGVQLCSDFRGRAMDVYGELGDSIARKLKAARLPADAVRECLEALVAGVDQAAEAVATPQEETPGASVRAHSARGRGG
jgi:DNA-binding MarR family transcriptional regulator